MAKGNAASRPDLDQLLHLTRDGDGAARDLEEDVEAVVECVRCADLKERMYGPGLRIARAVDEACDSRPNQGAGAHRAWLDRRVDGRTSQSVVRDVRRRRSDCDDLCMRGRITG